MHICKNSLEIHCAMLVNIGILTFHTQKNMDDQCALGWHCSPFFSPCFLIQDTAIAIRITRGTSHDVATLHAPNLAENINEFCRPFPKLTYPPKTGRAPQGNSSYSSSNHPLIFRGYRSFSEGICPEYWWAENEISFEVIKFSGDMLIFGRGI